MSLFAIDLLTVLGLLDADGNIINLDHLSGTELVGRLSYYMQKRRENFANEVNDLGSSRLDFSGLISSLSASNTMASIMPYSLACSRVIADDPLFRLAPGDDYDHQSALLLGTSQDKVPSRQRVADAIGHFSVLIPLIKDGILSVLPLHDLHKAEGALPFVFSEDGFQSSVPNHVYDYVHKTARVSPVQRIGGSLIVPEESVKKPSRGIHVSFRDDYQEVAGMFYVLATMSEPRKTETGELVIKRTIDWDTPPDPSMFDAWVRQSINQTVRRRLLELSKELALAETIGATYITESDFEARICSLPSAAQPPAPDHLSAINFLHANLPTLHSLSPSSVAKLRRENQTQFDQFHKTLLGVSSELNGTTENFERKARQLFAKEIEPQIRDIEERWKKLQYSGVGALVTAGASFGLAVLGAPTLPLVATLVFSTLIGGATAATSIAEYFSGRNSPAFVWSKIKR